MYKEYSGELYPRIEIKELFEGDYNAIARTLGYNTFKDVLAEQSKRYELNKYNPFLMNDMDILVERIYKHIMNGSNILVFGDFDVDGISSAAILLRGLIYAKGTDDNLDVIIPNREVGYSIKREYILDYINNPKKVDKYPDLIITVDCGIKSAEDIDFIVNQLGIEVLVTDHHGVDENALPTAATAIVNPHREGSEYPFKEISGSMVALKVMEAYDIYVREILGEIPFQTGPQGRFTGVMDELQELAMLGTIADVMPIVDENKWLVKDTLTRLGKSKNMGLRYFVNSLSKEYQNSGNGALNTDIVGWQIGPRINAAGRIGKPEEGLKMFLTDDLNNIATIYKSLNSTNKERQEIVAEDYNNALSLIKKNKLNNGIVYINPELMDGIIGLIAGKLKEDFYRPAIAIGGKSTLVDLLYSGEFSEEQENALYTLLFAINEDFYAEKKIDLFYGVSIKDSNKVIFSIAENSVSFIEGIFTDIFESLPSYIQESNALNYLDQNKKNLLLEVISTIDLGGLEFSYTTIFKGSCRSVEGFNITEALDYLNEEYKAKTGEPLLLGFGGHQLAAGFGISEDKVFEFKRLFERLVNDSIDEEILQKQITANIEIRDFSLVTPKLVNMIHSMGPYGNRNEHPRVVLVGRPVNADIIGRTGNTLKMLLEDPRGRKVEALFFRYKDREEIKNFCDMVLNDPNAKNIEVGLLGTLDINEFNNVETAQLKPMDIIYNV